MAKRISEITTTKTELDGTENIFGYDSSALVNFKSTGPTKQREYTANAVPNKLVDGDFRYWSNGTSFSTQVYTADMWYFRPRTTTSTVTRQDNIDPDVDSYFLRIHVTANAAQYVQIETRLKDVSLLAGKNVSVFIRAKSDSGVSNVRLYIDRNNDIGSIPSDDTWRWYRADMVVPDVSGLTITAGNYTRVLIQNSTSELFKWDIDKVRVIETPTGLKAGEIPEWIKGDENARKVEQEKSKYYSYLTGDFLPPLIFGRAYNAANNIMFIPTGVQMVKAPIVTASFATNHIANITTGTGIATSGGQTWTLSTVQKNGVSVVMSDAATTYTVNNTHWIFIRSFDQNRYVILDSRY
jgi:hypothetical protein